MAWGPDYRRQAARTGTALARQALDATIPEADFQRTVVKLAKTFHWLVYHSWTSMHSAKGFPDLVLARSPRVIFAELKSEKGKVRPEQQDWLDELAACPGVEVHVWRPSDLDEIEATLRRAA